MFSKLWILVRFSLALACPEQLVIAPETVELVGIQRDAAAFENRFECASSGSQWTALAVVLGRLRVIMSCVLA